MNKRHFKTIDLFAGVGGIRLGFEKAGFKTIFANDIDKNCKKTYDLNFKTTKLNTEDINLLKISSLPRFDVLLAGFPCQAFSIAGYKKGFKDKKVGGNLFFRIADILKEKKPSAILLENVKNLKGHDGGKTFKIIISFILCMILLLGSVSAFTFDNIKQYNSTTQDVTIRNSIAFIPTNIVAKIKLISPLNVIVPRGYQKVAEFEIVYYKDNNGGLDKMEFFDKTLGNLQINRDYDFKVLSYEDEIRNSYDCSENDGSPESQCKINGTYIKQKEVWKKFTPANLKKNEVLTIGVFTDVQKGDYIEWIPKFYGVKINEWATWTESLNVDLISYYNLEESSGNAIDQVGSNNCSVSANYQATGIIDYGYDFVHGDGDYVDCPMDFLSDYTDPRSYSLWFKADVIALNYYLMTHTGKYTGRTQITFHASNNIRFAMYGDGTDYWEYGFTDNISYHNIIMSYDGSVNHIYLDGVSIQNVSTGTIDATGDAEGETLNLNSYHDESSNGDGIIDEVGVWNRSLTMGEALDLWNGGAGLSYGSAEDILTYSNAQTNNSDSGESTKFSILVNDSVVLETNGQYIFSTNNTGTWVNESAVNFTSTPQWANVTKILNDTQAITIGYRYYLTNNIGTLYQTPIYELYIPDNQDPETTLYRPLDSSLGDNLSINYIANETDNIGLESSTIHIWNSTGSEILNSTNPLNGNMWIADYNGGGQGYITKVLPNGTSFAYALTGTFNYPHWIVMDNDSMMWIPSWSGGGIEKVYPNGTSIQYTTSMPAKISTTLWNPGDDMIWFCGGTSEADTLYKMTKSGSVSTVLSLPDVGCRALGWDGTYVWANSEGVDSGIVTKVLLNGTSWNYPGTTDNVNGMTFNGTHMFLGGGYAGNTKFSYINVNTGVITNVSVSSEGLQPIFPFYDGEGSVWFESQDNATAVRYWTNNGTLNYYKGLGLFPYGSAYNPSQRSMWFASRNSNVITKIDIDTGTMTNYTLPASYDPHGVAFDGATLSATFPLKVSSEIWFKILIFFPPDLFSLWVFADFSANNLHFLNSSSVNDTAHSIKDIINRIIKRYVFLVSLFILLYI